MTDHNGQEPVRMHQSRSPSECLQREDGLRAPPAAKAMPFPFRVQRATSGADLRLFSLARAVTLAI